MVKHFIFRVALKIRCIISSIKMRFQFMKIQKGIKKGTKKYNTEDMPVFDNYDPNKSLYGITTGYMNGNPVGTMSIQNYIDVRDLIFKQHGKCQIEIYHYLTKEDDEKWWFDIVFNAFEYKKVGRPDYWEGDYVVKNVLIYKKRGINERHS